MDKSSCPDCDRHNSWRMDNACKSACAVPVDCCLDNMQKIEGVSDFCHIWNCQVYAFLKYITFKSNERPFPFAKLAESD